MGNNNSYIPNENEDIRSILLSNPQEITETIAGNGTIQFEVYLANLIRSVNTNFSKDKSYYHLEDNLDELKLVMDIITYRISDYIVNKNKEPLKADLIAVIDKKLEDFNNYNNEKKITYDNQGLNSLIANTDMREMGSVYGGNDNLLDTMEKIKEHPEYFNIIFAFIQSWNN